MTNTDDNNTELRAAYYFKEWREYAGYNQTQLAKLMGVEPGTVSRIENGMRQFTQGWLEDFALACDIPGGPCTVLQRAPDRPRERPSDMDVERRAFDIAHALVRPVIKAVRKSADRPAAAHGGALKKRRAAKPS